MKKILLFLLFSIIGTSYTQAATVRTVLTEQDLRIQISGEKPVIVVFTAQWSGPCKMYYNTYTEIASQYNDVIVCKVDVDEFLDIDYIQRLQIMGVPTTLLYSDGNEVSRGVGVLKKDILENAIKQLLKTKA